MRRGASDSFGYHKILVKTFRVLFPPVPKGVHLINHLALGDKQTLVFCNKPLCAVLGRVLVQSWDKARSPQASPQVQG